MNLETLEEYCERMEKQYPELSDGIWGAYQLAYGETDVGESEEHECELAINYIEELIEEL